MPGVLPVAAGNATPTPKFSTFPPAFLPLAYCRPDATAGGCEGSTGSNWVTQLSFSSPKKRAACCIGENCEFEFQSLKRRCLLFPSESVHKQKSWRKVTIVISLEATPLGQERPGQPSPDPGVTPSTTLRIQRWAAASCKQGCTCDSLVCIEGFAKASFSYPRVLPGLRRPAFRPIAKLGEAGSVISPLFLAHLGGRGPSLAK